MNKRIYWMDILRITALFCVMLMHSVASCWYITPVTQTEWHIYNIYDGLIRFCVPVFIMISGSMFLNPDREIPVSLLYRKYIPRILCAYIFLVCLLCRYTETFCHGRFKRGTLQRNCMGHHRQPSPSPGSVLPSSGFTSRHRSFGK